MVISFGKKKGKKKTVASNMGCLEIICIARLVALG